MRRKGHFFRILMTAVLLLGLLPLNGWAAGEAAAGEATVLFTHDLHSCFFQESGRMGRIGVALPAWPLPWRKSGRDIRTP